MQQIAEWLEKLGMSEYAERFTENGISVAALRHLTDQDLKDIGVLLGHRRILLAAIGDLTGAPPAVSKPVAAAEPKAQDAAERRQVTVMFSDLVGSTALAGRMDPEDLREVISAYQKCVAETVQRFGGFVAKYMGDGVLIYFGYPQAHDDDAERAVRAGLELIAAVSALKAPVSLQIGAALGGLEPRGFVRSGKMAHDGKQDAPGLRAAPGAGRAVALVCVVLDQPAGRIERRGLDERIVGAPVQRDDGRGVSLRDLTHPFVAGGARRPEHGGSMRRFPGRPNAGTRFRRAGACLPRASASCRSPRSTLA